MRMKRTILDYMNEYSKALSSNEKLSVKKKQKEISQDSPKETKTLSNTNDTPAQVQDLTSKDSSMDVDPIYQNIRDEEPLNTKSKIMFSNPADYKEPNINEIRKISLY